MNANTAQGGALERIMISEVPAGLKMNYMNSYDY